MTRSDLPPAGPDRPGSGEEKSATEASGVAQPAPSPIPLELAHPLELFGDDCEVKGCVSVALPDPDTVLRIVYGHGFESFTRHFEPGKHQLLRQVRYWVARRHQPTDTTMRLIAQMLEPLYSEDIISDIRAGQLPSVSQRFLPWRTLVKAMDHGKMPEVARSTNRQIAGHLREREAFYARLKHHERAGRKSPERTHLESQLPSSLAAWRELNPNLSQAIYLLVEEALHCMAHFEVLWSPPSSVGEPSSQVVTLLYPAHRPLGLWLQEVVRASRADSLIELQDILFRLDVRHKKRHISLDLLKKWSACRQMLLPIEAVEPLLSAVREREVSHRLEGRFLLARLLTYLTALVRAGTDGEPPDWHQAQYKIKSRYTEVYQLAVHAAQTSS